jgi:hypothetical protein
MENTSFFFGDSTLEGKQSTLQVAMKELEELKAAHLQSGRAYALLLWTTVDLLSRFYSGQLHNQRAMKRLKDFLREFFPHDRKTTGILLFFRNACIHSVNLFASDSKGGKEVRFKVVLEGPLVEYNGRTHCKINIVRLEEGLRHSIENYHRTLLKDENLKSRFEKVFRKMGYVNL